MTLVVKGWSQRKYIKNQNKTKQNDIFIKFNENKGDSDINCYINLHVEIKNETFAIAYCLLYLISLLRYLCQFGQLHYTL